MVGLLRGIPYHQILVVFGGFVFLAVFGVFLCFLSLLVGKALPAHPGGDPKRQGSIRSLPETPKRQESGIGWFCSRGDPQGKVLSAHSRRNPKGKNLASGGSVPGETQQARFYPLTPATAGRGSCDGHLGPRRDPKGKNHISVLSRRDPKGKVLPGEVVAIAPWAPWETQQAGITYPFSPGETQKARFRRGG